MEQIELRHYRKDLAGEIDIPRGAERSAGAIDSDPSEGFKAIVGMDEQGCDDVNTADPTRWLGLDFDSRMLIVAHIDVGQRPAITRFASSSPVDRHGLKRRT